MKIYICFVFTLMNACSAPTEIPPPEESDASATVPMIDNENSGSDSHQSSNEHATCERFEKIVIRGDGGVFKEILIPLPCDPFWKMKDHGDPPFNEE